MIAPDQPVDVRPGEANNLEALNQYLVNSGSPIGKITGQKQFPGGYSNLTYLLQSASGEFILRRPPLGAAIKSAHDMGREYKILNLIQDHYPLVPKPIAYCESPEVIGGPFYIMERLQGIILRPTMATDLRFQPEKMKSISESVVDNLVRLHNIDVVSTGLIQLGKPEGYIQRQVEGWTKRYAAAQTDTIADMVSLASWLNKNPPLDAPPVLLHNDYKYDNLVLNESNSTEIIGVLDWEMATVGDPGMDLGASLAYWAEAGDDDLAKVFNISWLPGNLTRKQVYSRYQEKSGRTIINPVFYYAFGLFKNAVIAQQIYARWKQGHSKDARFSQLIHVIHNLAHRGILAIENDSI